MKNNLFAFILLGAFTLGAITGCDDKDDNEKIKVKTLVSIAVTTQPTKKIYAVNEAFNPAGMVVTATYSDQSTAPVTITAAMFTYNFSAAGANKTVTITYEGKTASVTGITVTAAEATLISVVITTQPAKKTYMVGEAFDPAEMVVTAIYSDGTTAPVTVTDAMLSYNFSTVGTNKTVTITYEGKSATVTGITITAAEATLVSVVITTQPAKKTYTVGETFDPAGMVVTAIYSNGSTTPVTVTVAMFTYNFSAAGADKIVTITYEGKTATVTGITVTMMFEGSGTSSNPYLIGTAEQLAKLAELVNASNTDYNDKYYKMIADINLSAYNVGNGWTPIGNYTSVTRYNAFKGNFDGNNHKVIGLYFSSSNGVSYVGLFGYILGGVVQNLGVYGSIRSGIGVGVGGSQVAGLVGAIESGSINNCYSAVDIHQGAYNIGGLAGYVYESSVVSNCYATGTITGNYGGGNGGLVGALSFDSHVINCYATGAVSRGYSSVGGLVGSVFSGSSVTNSYATGSVNGADASIGGLVGSVGSGSSINNCYARGTASGNQSVGGLAGYVSDNSRVSNCYTTGAVSGKGDLGYGNTGGLAGTVNNSTVENCAALNSSITRRDSNVDISFGRVAGLSYNGAVLTNNAAWSGMVIPSGSLSGSGGTNISTTQAKTQTTYTSRGWAFGNNDNSPWKMGVGAYTLPVLYWQTTAPAAMPSHL